MRRSGRHAGALLPMCQHIIAAAFFKRTYYFFTSFFSLLGGLTAPNLLLIFSYCHPIPRSLCWFFYGAILPSNKTKLPTHNIALLISSQGA